jgi:phage tail tape-measure protein
MTILGKIPGGLPGKIGRRLARHPIAVVSVVSLGYRMGKDALKVRAGEIDDKEWRARAGSHLGSLTGGIAGAAAGAIALSMVPGIGPLLGGFAGGLAGEFGGSKVGRAAIETIEDTVRDWMGHAAAGNGSPERGGRDDT